MRKSTLRLIDFLVTTSRETVVRTGTSNLARECDRALRRTERIDCIPRTAQAQKWDRRTAARAVARRESRAVFVGVADEPGAGGAAGLAARRRGVERIGSGWV